MAAGRLYAQVTITPTKATVLDTITITFNAAQGNAALANYNGPVFMHTGLITQASTSSSDWKNVVDNWGTVDSTVLMNPLGNNLYTKTIYIQSFYGINCGTIVDSLAFVFRNADGSVVGRSVTGGDMFVPLNQPAGTYSPGNYITHNQTGNRLQIVSTTGVITLDVFTTGIRVLEQQDTAIATDPSYAVIDSLLVPQVPVVQNNAAYLSFPYDAAHTVLIQKNPVSVMLLNGTDTIFAAQPGWVANSCSLAGSFRMQGNEAFWGGGSRSGNVNLRGNYYQLNNQAQSGYGNGTLNLNISIPFFVSSRGYGILFDNQYTGTADIGSTDTTKFKVSFTGGPMRYFLVPGNTYKEISGNYTAVTGHQDLPPLWALGYIQSKYGYQTEAEARSVVTQLQQLDFPISGLVLDLYWFGGTSAMGNLNWDNTAFPNHNQMIQDFLDTGVKTIVIMEPYITKTSANYSTAASNKYLATNSGGQPYQISNFWAGPASLLDITLPAARPWFWGFYQQRIADGVSGFWSDLGEPETDPADMYRYAGGMQQTHNIFALQWAQTLYNGYKQNYPSSRMFNLSRSGYAGMQRYSTFPWSGDVARSWSGMQAQIPIMISMGMSGVGYMHSDIGGFTNGPQNDELYARWQQMGAFMPVERAHGSGVPTAPTDYPANVQDIVRTFTKLRMGMLPYNYSLAWQNTTTGAPLVRGLFYEEPDFTQPYTQINDEYLWGPNILVAPVMQGGATSRQVTLPTGYWYDWWTGTGYNGHTTITMSAPLTTMPLLVRGDAFLPMTPAVNSTKQYDTKTLQIHYYLADTTKTADFTVYMDDGVSTNTTQGNNRTMHFTGRHGQQGDAALWIALAQQGGYTGEPAQRSLTYIIHNVIIPASDSVVVTGTTGRAYLQQVPSQAAFNQSDSVYFYDAGAKILYAKYTTGYDSSRLAVQSETLSGVPYAANHNNKLMVYPNPSRDKINIVFDVQATGNYTLRVCDMAGRQRYSQTNKLAAGHQIMTWNGSQLTPGTYTVSVSDGQDIWQQKVTFIK